MPVVLAWLSELILSSIGAWCLKALIGIGIGFLTYHVVVKPVEAAIRAQFASAGVLLDYIGWLGIDQGVTIILSALAGRAAISAAQVHLAKKS